MKRLQGKKGTWRKWVSSIVYAYGMITFVWPVRAFAAIAAGGALPWDTPLTTLQTDLQGPVAHAVTTAAVIGTGIMWSVSEHGTGVRKMSSLAFVGACALGATQVLTTLFPMGGALF
jgi:type IV secretion system protein TrbC